MKEIIALQQYTDKTISLYEGEIRNIEDTLANKLIEQNIVAEHAESGGGGGNSSIIFVEGDIYNEKPRIKETWQNLYNYLNDSKIVIIKIENHQALNPILDNITYLFVYNAQHVNAKAIDGPEEWKVCTSNMNLRANYYLTFTATSANDFPIVSS